MKLLLFGILSKSWLLLPKVSVRFLDIPGDSKRFPSKETEEILGILRCLPFSIHYCSDFGIKQNTPTKVDAL